MNLETGQENTANEVQILPVTDMVIKAVEALAEKQEMIGLKIVSKNKVPILPTNWTAGVDYDEDIFDAIDEDYQPKPTTAADKELNEKLCNRFDPTVEDAGSGVVEACGPNGPVKPVCSPRVSCQGQ